ncbi:hypothetical protein FNV64_04285 [Streptomyces sp. S1A1-7]|nr:hypothetical protein FNV64_04285 [Streptomyces sp. S1A1-7]
MNHTRGIPAAPSDRDLPNHRRTREELLMKIGPENNRASLRRRWGVPLGPVWSCDLVGPRPGRVGGLGVKRWGVSTSTFGCRVGVRLPVSAGR